MGRIREFYDALMYRRAPIADEDLLAVGPSSDSRLNEILDLTDADYILVNADDYVISCSETVSNIGLVKNNRITSEAIRKLIRSARNKNEIIESEVAIPRGVIAAGYHE